MNRYSPHCHSTDWGPAPRVRPAGSACEAARSRESRNRAGRLGSTAWNAGRTGDVLRSRTMRRDEAGMRPELFIIGRAGPGPLRTGARPRGGHRLDDEARNQAMARVSLLARPLTDR